MIIFIADSVATVGIHINKQVTFSFNFLFMFGNVKGSPRYIAGVDATCIVAMTIMMRFGTMAWSVTVLM